MTIQNLLRAYAKVLDDELKLEVDLGVLSSIASCLCEQQLDAHIRKAGNGYFVIEFCAKNAPDVLEPTSLKLEDILEIINNLEGV